MTISRADMATVLAQRTLHGPLPRAEARSLAAYLLRHGRTGELTSLLRDVRQLWAEAGDLTVTATSARPLPPAIVQDVKTEVRRLYPGAKHIAVAAHLDPSVIGGVLLEIGDHRLDLTIRGRFKNFMTAALGGDL